MTTFVVCGDSDVDELGRGVGIAKSDDGNVDVGGFFDSLSIGARVRCNEEAGLFERASDVVGQITRSEATSSSSSAGVSGEFEHSTLTIRTSRNNGDVSGVVDSCNDASCKDDFFPETTESTSAAKSPDNFLDSYQVLPMLITLTPSGRVCHKYGSI